MPSSRVHAARLRSLAARHHALVGSDRSFQRRARLLQALWREAQGLPIGKHRGGPLGSRLAMPEAKDSLANYLTPAIRDVVRAEVLDPIASAGKLYATPRIFNDLLSSQPLCFNLFAELQCDLETATTAFRALLGPEVARVTRVAFEHSPGRGDPTYTADRSAFDAFIEYDTPDGHPAFVGIEVKYHESLNDRAATHRARYDEVAEAMGVFCTDAFEKLRDRPLQQIWRDHLLAGSLALYGPYARGHFAFIYPALNDRCEAAVRAYEGCLQSGEGFHAWTLERVVETMTGATTASWPQLVAARYLAFSEVDALLDDA